MAGNDSLRGVATDDTLYIRKGEGPIMGNLLSNDMKGEGLSYSLRNVSGESISSNKFTAPDEVTVKGQFGTFVVKADGSYTYTLNDNVQFNKGQTLTDSFNYKISDGNGNTDFAVVTVNASGRPLAVDDSYAFSFNDPNKVYNPLSNDVGGANGKLFLRSTTESGVGTTIDAKHGPDKVTMVQGEYGKFNFKADGTFTYSISDDAANRVNNGEKLVEVLDQYKISDGAGNTDVATITLDLHTNNHSTSTDFFGV